MQLVTEPRYFPRSQLEYDSSDTLGSVVLFPVVPESFPECTPKRLPQWDNKTCHDLHNMQNRLKYQKLNLIKPVAPRGMESETVASSLYRFLMLFNTK